MKAPLIHCLTNVVTAPFVADSVVALGGRPLMAEALGECAQLAQAADGLLINLGQLTEAKRRVILASLEARQGRPWVLDPVGVGFFPERLAFAQHLMGFRPTCLRGNASEIWALATGGRSGSGTESDLQAPVAWEDVTRSLKAKEVCITQAGRGAGQRDLSLEGGQARWFAGGQPLMGQLAGFGCALSAAAATLGSGAQALELFSQAGRAVQSIEVGAFRADFISHLAQLARRARVRRALPLCFVAGPQDCADLPGVLRAALAGGITCFQYRPKGIDGARALELGQALRALCAAAGVPFVVNDSVEMAQALNADGVHLGQGDGCPVQARRALGGQALIGLSVSLRAHWQTYAAQAVDYVGLGPFATTQTKPDARAPLGCSGLAALREGWAQVPSLAIGGIDLDSAAQALSSGVDGLAVIRAIAGAPDPRRAVESLKHKTLNL